jgi:sulfur relay (sulfurtransferase) DsrF/TusC family protein
MIQNDTRDYEHFQTEYNNTFDFIVEDVESFGSFYKTEKNPELKSKIIGHLLEDYDDVLSMIGNDEINKELSELLLKNVVIAPATNFKIKLTNLLFDNYKETIEKMYEEAECYISDRSIQNRKLEKADDEYVRFKESDHTQRVLHGIGLI